MLFRSLQLESNGQVIGKARVLETPMGQIVKGLLESDCSVGVSSRGMGSMKPVNGINEVQNDFRLVTAADVVADPSAPNAFVNGIMEGVDWIFNEQTGEWAEACQKRVQKRWKANRNDKGISENAKMHLFNQFLAKL